jgi:negative regulator of sigma E activity
VSFYLFLGSLAAIASLAFPAFASETSQPEPLGAVRLVSQVNEAETRRESDIHKMVSTRRYVLSNKRWEKDAVMDVRVTYESGVGKKFEILTMDNAGGLQKRAFEKILESEVEASKKSLEMEDGAITAANYEFTPLGMETLNGKECMVLELKPKRSSKYLLNGKVWIDLKEHAIIRVEGRTARSVSFWIGKPYIAQTFRKVDDVWVSASNRSVSDVKLLGKTELSVDFTDYKIVRGHREIARTRHLD